MISSESEKDIMNNNKTKSIMLIQYNENFNSRTYFNAETREEIIEKVFSLYETFLIESRDLKTSKVKIVQMSELLTFVYSLYDFAYLEYDKENKIYKPYGKDWFSEILINKLTNRLK
jgi:hypothetical protein